MQQKSNCSVFKDAVAYAKDIIANPLKRAAYVDKVKPGESVYHFALKEYIGRFKT